MTRQGTVDQVAALAASLENEGPLSRDVAACLYSLAGAVAAGEPWFQEVAAFLEDQSRRFLETKEVEHAN